MPDRGVGCQGWNECTAPVLWTEWPLESGVVLRQEVFARLPGGIEVETAIEPLYAWVRLSVKYADSLNAPDSAGSSSGSALRTYWRTWSRSAT